jgi:hypothetical protein
MVSTTLSLAKFAVVDSGEAGRSAVYSRYISGPWTVPLGMGEFCVLSFTI